MRRLTRRLVLPLFGVLWLTVLLLFWVTKIKFEVPAADQVQTPKVGRTSFGGRRSGWPVRNEDGFGGGPLAGSQLSAGCAPAPLLPARLHATARSCARPPWPPCGGPPSCRRIGSWLPLGHPPEEPGARSGHGKPNQEMLSNSGPGCSIFEQRWKVFFQLFPRLSGFRAEPPHPTPSHQVLLLSFWGRWVGGCACSARRHW